MNTNKYVYLFELDSVRKTDEEILKGQKALFNELVYNGNTIVLTINQLIDSRWFFSLINNKDSSNYDSFIKLFEFGAIKISQYGNVRTIAQYIIDRIDDNPNFIYSALPIKSTQKRLLALVKRSLILSDLSEINYYLNGDSSDDDLKDLFIEINNDTAKETELTKLETVKILNQLSTFLSFIFKISPIPNLYLAPKVTEDRYKFQYILNKVLSFEPYQVDNTLWKDSTKLLKNLYNTHPNVESRSIYIKELAEEYNKLKTNKTAYQFAEAIVNCVYNFVCELSIYNISKHYDINDFYEPKNNDGSFYYDFFNRLLDDWNNAINADDKYLQSESNLLDGFESDELPNFKIAEKICSNYQYNNNNNNDYIYSYEYMYKENKRKNKNYIIKKTITSFIKSSAYVLLILASDYLLGLIFGYIENYFNIISLPLQIVFYIAYITFYIFKLFAIESISNYISKITRHNLSMFDTFNELKQAIQEACYICRSSNTYYNINNNDSSKEKHIRRFINYYLSSEMRKYLKNKNTEEKLLYPIVNLKDDTKLRQLMYLEETKGYKFGEIYRSKFNTFNVDPIDANVPYPYENLSFTSTKNGTVILTKYQDKFLLLKKKRQAINSTLIECVRGFNELGLNSSNNATKEVNEEISGIINDKPILLGTITPDSGILGNYVDIFYAYINDFSNNIDHEGNDGIILLTDDEMKEYIINGQIKDSFTIIAYELYRYKFCIAK